MSARETTGRATRIVTVGAVLLVAAVAALVSFAHMWTVGHRAGEGWRAWVLPLSVDGLVVAASMSLLTSRRAGLPGGRLAWVALMGGVAASLAANVAAAEATVTARVVAAWPALAFAIAFELLLQQRREPVAEPVVEPAIEPAVDPVVEPAPAVEPVVHQPVEPPDFRQVLSEVPPEPAIEPVVERGHRTDRRPAKDSIAGVEPHPSDADLIERVRRAVDVDGRPPGRRQLARQFGVTEHRVRKILDLPATNGRGTP